MFLYSFSSPVWLTCSMCSKHHNPLAVRICMTIGAQAKLYKIFYIFYLWHKSWYIFYYVLVIRVNLSQCTHFKHHLKLTYTEISLISIHHTFCVTLKFYYVYERTSTYVCFFFLQIYLSYTKDDNNPGNPTHSSSIKLVQSPLYIMYVSVWSGVCLESLF